MYLIVDCYAADGNGLEEYTGPFAEELAEFFRICRFGNYYGSKNDIRAYFVISERFTCSHLRKYVRSLEYIVAGILLLFFTIYKRPKFVHFQWFLMPTFDLLIVSFLKVFTSAEIIYTAHNVVSHNKRDPKVLKFLLQKLDITLVHSRALKDEYTHFYEVDKERVFSLMHGNKQDFNIIETDLSIVPSESNYILFAGLVNENKGVLRLLQSWERKGVNFDLIVLGKVNDRRVREYCERSSMRNVKVYDRFVSKSEFQYFLSHCKFVVLPYLKGSVSGVLFSAGLSKKAVLTTDFGGISEYIINGKTGIVAKTWEEFERTLSSLNDYDWQMMGNENHEYLKEEFNWKALIARYVDYLDQRS